MEPARRHPEAGGAVKCEPLTLPDLLRLGRRSTPNAIALTGDGISLSWTDLDVRTDRVASLLRRRGVRKGDRVGILATNGPRWIEVFFGIHKTGAVVVPLNYRLEPAECAYLLDDAGVTVAVIGAELSVLPGFPGTTLALGTDFDAELRSAKDEDGRSQADDPEGATLPDDLAVIAYTSGTTGLPKGVMWSHRALLASAQVNPFPRGVAGGARVLVCAPLFAGGGVLMACNAIAIGATLVVSHFAPDVILRTLVDAEIEFTGMVPTMISLLVDAAPPGWVAPSLRCLYYGAGRLSPGLFTRARSLFRCQFQQAYGMTETCILGTRLDAAEHTLDEPELLASAGRPMPGVTLRIIDDSGADVPPGTPGEILIRSAGNMLGYWRRPADTSRAFQAGWYHTNDIGRLDDHGRLYLLDRKDDMVKSGGLNVSPAEVEGVLLAHPELEEAAVIGLADDRWGQRVAAVVRRRTGASLAEDDLAAFCRERLADYKRPRTIIFTDEPLPRNALGKVTRTVLRARYDSNATLCKQ